MSLANVKIDWDARPYINQVRQAMNEVVKEGAEYVEERAKTNLERAAPDSTGTLASQIEVTASKFGDGGYIVGAQMRGNTSKAIIHDVNAKWGKGGDRYYASFVELGTRKMAGLAYLRKALKSGKFKMRAILRKRLECIVGE